MDIRKTIPQGERKLPYTDPKEPDYPAASSNPTTLSLSKLLDWVKGQKGVGNGS